MIEQFRRLDGLVKVAKDMVAKNVAIQVNSTLIQFNHYVKPFAKETSCSEDLFHGMGREDIDAAMLGSGRPFTVLELRMPRKEIDLVQMEKEINEENEGRIAVNNLKFVDRKRVAELKNTVCDKTYRVDVSIRDRIPIESLKKASQRLTAQLLNSEHRHVCHIVALT